MKIIWCIVLLALVPALGWSQAKIGQMVPKVELSGDAGGRLDGTPWSSSELKGKVHVFFYADPDEKDLNNHVGEALRAEKFDRSKYASIAVVNMAATWLPNFAIEGALEDKQKEFPNTLYLKDMDKHFVNKWGIADDTSDVLAFAPDGKLIFHVDGKLSDADVKKLIQVIKKNLP